MVNNKSSSKRFAESRFFRLYIGNGNWVNLTREVTEDLYDVYKKGKATRYELAPGLLLDIIPNDVDCNSKNTDLACLMRVDLCYENDSGEINSEEDTQQRMSKYIKNQLEKQGIIDAFPPTKRSDDKLPRVTSLPTHRHLSMVPTPPTSVNRRNTSTTTNTTPSRTMSKDDCNLLQVSSSDNPSPSSLGSKNKATTNKKQRKSNKRRRTENQESPEAGVPVSVGEDDNCLEQLHKNRMASATDQELQYHYYSLGQQHQHVMLSATPSTYRPHTLPTAYYTTDKSLLLRTPSPPPMLSDLSIDRHYHHHHQHHDHEGSIDSAENNHHSFYGTDNVLSHAEEQTYPLLSLSHEPQNWSRTFHSSRSSSLHNHQEQHDNYPIVAAAAAVAVATDGDYGYYSHHQQHDSKLHPTQPYQMVPSALQHQQDTSINDTSVSLSNTSSPQSMLLPQVSSEEAFGGFQSNYPASDRSALHHRQDDYNEQSASTFMVDSEQPSQD
ncbi:hypothetical protein BDC45DRAFT_529493 [Circinella umbellata]|nr:hypothetical protein BDC45DRAFT_529493 [Circinella umbellata]